MHDFGTSGLRAGLAGRWRRRGVRLKGGLILSDRLWDGWMRAYADADPTSIVQPTLRCRGCGSFGLRLVYTGGDNLLGYASMWCPACRTGIATCRTAIPADAPRLPCKMPDHERTAVIDDYQLLYSHHDEPAIRRWLKHAAAALGLGMGLILVAGVAAALLGLPQAAAFLLRPALPTVFAAFGVVSAISLYVWWRDRRDLHPGNPRRRLGRRRKADDVTA